MAIDLSRMHLLEWVMWLIPIVVIVFAIYGIAKHGWSFTTSFFWRLTCFILPILPILIGVTIYAVCKLVGYDNGSMEGFHPDSFAFGCFLVLTPIHIVLAMILSLLAKGMRLVALAVNIGLGMLWLYAVLHIRM